MSSDDSIERFYRVLLVLPPRERKVIEARMDGMTFRAIGQEIHVGGARAAQIYDRALHKLRHPLYVQVLKGERPYEDAPTYEETERARAARARARAVKLAEYRAGVESRRRAREAETKRLEYRWWR